jgi:hypothetical protein
MGTDRPLNVLLLCNRTGRSIDARTVTDHLDAFGRYSRHRVQELSFLRELPAALDLAQFDVVVIHYTIAIGWLSEHYLSEASKQKVREFGGLKALFIQDEYRAVRQLHEALRFMKINLLFTCVPEGEIEKVYPEAALPGMAKASNLTGYVPQTLIGLTVAPTAQRPIDVGYRSRKPPYWLGELAYEKWQIAERFAARAAGTGLALNLSYEEGDRLYGPAWTRFIASCKAVLGVESGSSVFDFDGTLQKSVEDYVAAHPSASFEEVQARFLAPYEGRVRYNQISPRCFEAAALRTAMVLYEGEYSGVLQPWRHYVPLRKDFGNFQEVLDALRDTRKLQQIADCAFEEVAQNEAYSYRAFIGRFDDTVEREFARRGLHRPALPYSRTKYLSQIARSPSYMAHRVYSRVFQWLLLGPSRRRVMMKLWYSIPGQAREFVRPLLRWILGR